MLRGLAEGIAKGIGIILLTLIISFILGYLVSFVIIFILTKKVSGIKKWVIRILAPFVCAIIVMLLSLFLLSVLF